MLILCIWHVATLRPASNAPGLTALPLTAEQIEYAKLMGKSVDAPKKADGFPTLDQMAQTFVKHFADPFYDNGPNDKGIAASRWDSCWPVSLRFPSDL
jgi:nitrate/nitrite transport system permease protein